MFVEFKSGNGESVVWINSEHVTMVWPGDGGNAEVYVVGDTGAICVDATPEEVIARLTD